jgi:ligand-binding sensor domain-containing protein
MVAAGLFTVPIITTLALSDTQRPDIKAPAFTPITVAGGVGDLRAIAIVYETIYLATGAGLVTADVSDLETGLISGRPNPVLENLSDVLIDGDTIWISSYDDGVAQMDSGGWTLHTSAGLLPSVVVSGITRTDDGSIWFATGAGLLQIFPDGSSAVHFAKLGFYDVESSGLQLAAVSSKLLVQTEDVTDGAFDTFTISNMGFYAYDYYRTDQYFASISYDHDDLWILTDGSLVKFDASGNQFFWTPLNSCSGCASQASVISANGTFFVGFGSGVAMIPIGADPDGIDSWTEFEGERDFPGSKVRELFSLSNEIILAATDAGLVRINTAAPYLSSSIGYINAVPFASPQVVEVVSSEEYWVGTHGQIFQYLSGEWYPVELSIDMGLIKDLDLAPDGTLWVASLGGLIAVDTFTRTSKIIDGHLELGLSSPNSVAVSADGAVWVAFASGSKGSSTDIWVGRLHNGNWTTPKCPMGRNGLFYLGADSSGLVWAASSTGDLMRVDTGECQILDIGDLTFVMDLEVRADKVYVADGSRGVFVYDTASRSAELIEIDPLINAIDVGKDGQIWLATYDGVALIEGGDVDYFHFKDGIPSSYVTDVSIAQDGTLVVATANGLAIMAAGQNDASN